MKKLHVGSGKIIMDGYINIDIEPSHHSDICGNILDMDFVDVDVIYGCHFYEHLLFPVEAVDCLNLFHKWLKPNGILRLAVPDLELAAKAYANGSNLKFLYGEGFNGFYYKDCPAERLNFFVKSWNHQMCYDFNLLRELLTDAGFRNIEKKKANESAIPSFNHDRFISESLYVECIK